MKYIMTLVWSVLIGGALAYVLSSMATNPFDITQSLVFSAVIFVAIILMDAVLSADTEQ